MSSPVSFQEAALQVKSSLDIIEVVGQHVHLKKQGRSYVGLCPFHQDKKPSMHVSPEKQIYKCFSCGAGGDALRFVMELENKTYGEVIRAFAEAQGISIEQEGPQAQLSQQQKSDLELMEKALSLANEWYHSQLQGPAGESARAYLSARGLSEKTIQTFGLGLALDSWDALGAYLFSALPELGDRSGLLEKVGLSVSRKQGDGFYDKFRNRLMVPILDTRQRVLGFGGRALAPDQEPKYLNSPESPIYHKSKVLYGLPQALPAIRETHQVLVMEGYFDVIATHQGGFPFAVATCGTALTEDQVQLLLRQQVQTVILAFDGDAAGQKATLAAIERFRAAEQLRQRPLSLKVLQLPEGQDPDDFLKQPDGAAQFQQQLVSALDALEFQFNHALRDLDLKHWTNRLEAIYRLAPIISALAHPAHRRLATQWASRRWQLDEAALTAEIRQQLTQQPAPNAELPAAARGKRPSFQASGKVEKKFDNRAISSFQESSNNRSRNRMGKTRRDSPSLVDDIPSLRQRLLAKRQEAERTLCALFWLSPDAWTPLLALMEPLTSPVPDGGIANGWFRTFLTVVFTVPATLSTSAERLAWVLTELQDDPEAYTQVTEASFFADTLRQNWLGDETDALDESTQSALLTERAITVADSVIIQLRTQGRRQAWQAMNESLRRLEQAPNTASAADYSPYSAPTSGDLSRPSNRPTRSGLATSSSEEGVSQQAVSHSANTIQEDLPATDALKADVLQAEVLQADVLQAEWYASFMAAQAEDSPSS